MISDDTTQQTKRINQDTLREFVDRKWNDEIVPALTDYIAVPAKSPAFDPEWVKHGYLERVITDAAQWAEQQPVRGLKLEVIRLPGRAKHAPSAMPKPWPTAPKSAPVDQLSAPELVRVCTATISACPPSNTRIRSRFGNLSSKYLAARRGSTDLPSS